MVVVMVLVVVVLEEMPKDPQKRSPSSFPEERWFAPQADLGV